MSIIIYPDGRVQYGKGTLRGDFPNWDSFAEQQYLSNLMRQPVPEKVYFLNCRGSKYLCTDCSEESKYCSLNELYVADLTETFRMNGLVTCFDSPSAGPFSPKKFTVNAELTTTDLFWIIIVQGHSPGDPVYVMQEGTSDVRHVGEAHSDLSDFIDSEGLVLSIRYHFVKRRVGQRIHHTFIPFHRIVAVAEVVTSADHHFENSHHGENRDSETEIDLS